MQSTQSTHRKQLFIQQFSKLNDYAKLSLLSNASENHWLYNVSTDQSNDILKSFKQDNHRISAMETFIRMQFPLASLRKLLPLFHKSNAERIAKIYCKKYYISSEFLVQTLDQVDDDVSKTNVLPILCSSVFFCGEFYIHHVLQIIESPHYQAQALKIMVNAFREKIQTREVILNVNQIFKIIELPSCQSLAVSYIIEFLQPSHIYSLITVLSSDNIRLSVIKQLGTHNALGKLDTDTVFQIIKIFSSDHSRLSVLKEFIDNGKTFPDLNKDSQIVMNFFSNVDAALEAEKMIASTSNTPTLDIDEFNENSGNEIEDDEFYVLEMTDDEPETDNKQVKKVKEIKGVPSEEEVKKFSEDEKCKASNAKDDELCKICYESTYSYLLYPCLHACLCSACVVKTCNTDTKLCPICRTRIKKVFHIIAC